MMLKSLFNIRLKQGLRELKALGAGRSVFLLILLALGGIFVVAAATKNPHVHYVTAIYLGLPLLIHLKRKDKNFLKTHIQGHLSIYLLEYLLLSFPLLLPLFYSKEWLHGLLYLMGIGLIALIPPMSTHHFTHHPLVWVIPDADFEWKAGLRRNIWLVLPVWLIGIGASGFIGAVPVTLFILGIISLSFYEQGEPLAMLIAHEKGPRQLLWYKIKRHSRLFTSLTLPLILLFLFFHPESWYIPVVEWLLLLHLHWFVILVKYAFYEPNKRLAGAQAITLIGVLGTVMPIFLPLVWLLAIRYYRQGIHNLKPYLDDFR